MTTTRIILFSSIALLLFGCGQKNKETTSATVATYSVGDSIAATYSSKRDTSNQYIYDFMKVVIAEQELDLGNGLAIQPEQSCDLSLDDKSFLKTLLIDRNKNLTKNDTGVITVKLVIEKCLTETDIADMLLQKERITSFQWDNSRLGFNTANKKNWFTFSIPLFSKKGDKAIMMIRNLCPGLCGSGETILFKRVNNKWTSQSGGHWYH